MLGPPVTRIWVETPPMPGPTPQFCATPPETGHVALVRSPVNTATVVRLALGKVTVFVTVWPESVKDVMVMFESVAGSGFWRVRNWLKKEKVEPSAKSHSAAGPVAPTLSVEPCHCPNWKLRVRS